MSLASPGTDFVPGVVLRSGVTPLAVRAATPWSGLGTAKQCAACRAFTALHSKICLGFDS